KHKGFEPAQLIPCYLYINNLCISNHRQVLRRTRFLLTLFSTGKLSALRLPVKNGGFSNGVGGFQGGVSFCKYFASPALPMSHSRSLSEVEAPDAEQRSLSEVPKRRFPAS
ncbi:MAG TPA: hypothetical protein PLW67_04280, partial [Prolixibacteraceae bacterium]|nr:hypothetical protein [Prolixibacteraceae bacterium]